MKKIWMRVGMEVQLSEDEYKEFMKLVKKNDHNALDNFFEEHILPFGELSGETYIVGKNNGGVEEYDNPDEEVTFLF